jgi:hypothetical protein
MMLPLDELDGYEVESYDVPPARARDVGEATSATSSSAPAGPEPMNSTPDWVAWVGCVHPGDDRERDDCGLAWSRQIRAGPSSRESVDRPESST